MVFVDDSALIADEFHGVGKDFSCHEGLGLEEEIFGQFEAVEAIPPPHLIHFSQKQLPYLRIEAELCVAPLNALGLGQELELVRIRSYNC